MQSTIKHLGSIGSLSKDALFNVNRGTEDGISSGYPIAPERQGDYVDFVPGEVHRMFLYIMHP